MDSLLKIRTLFILTILLATQLQLIAQLSEAVKRLDYDSTLLLLNQGMDPDTVLSDKRALIFHACELGDSLMLRILLLNRADPGKTDELGATPLVYRVLAGDFILSHLLLEFGAYPDQRDKYGATPLLYAAASNKYELCDLLLYYGANPQQRDKEGNDALMTAVCFGHLECADVLLQRGFDPENRDHKENSPLMIASQKGDRDLVSLLLEYRASPAASNKLNYTPLAHAVHFDRYRVSSILLDKGADPNHLVKSGRSIYDLAEIKGNEQVESLLAAKGGKKGRGIDLSLIRPLVGYSFNGREGMLQMRLQLQERKNNFFLETGMDIRTTYQAVEVDDGDPFITQYRELRYAWVHGVGKELPMIRDGSNEYGFFLGLAGLLSWANRRGFPNDHDLHYSLMPQFGAYAHNGLFGARFAVERYQFGTALENPWKFSVGGFINLKLLRLPDPWKEIEYK